MSALIPAIIDLIMSRMRKGGGGAGGVPGPELSQLEKNQRYSRSAILGGDMALGPDGKTGVKLSPQRSYSEITGRRQGK